MSFRRAAWHGKATIRVESSAHGSVSRVEMSHVKSQNILRTSDIFLLLNFELQGKGQEVDRCQNA